MNLNWFKTRMSKQFTPKAAPSYNTNPENDAIWNSALETPRPRAPITRQPMTPPKSAYLTPEQSAARTRKEMNRGVATPEEAARYAAGKAKYPSSDGYRNDID